jgi:hypothetical protein
MNIPFPKKFNFTNLDDRAILTELVVVNNDLVTRAPLFDLQIGVSSFTPGLDIGTAQVDAFLSDPSSFLMPDRVSTPDKNLPADISELYVFGDLLSDTGNLFRATSEATGAGFPPSPFFEGRYSNGPLWVESLALELGVPYNFSTNFALIGAPTGLDNVGNPFEPNDAVEQLGLPGTLGHTTWKVNHEESSRYGL